jgi:serine/threonine protein kinase
MAGFGLEFQLITMPKDRIGTQVTGPNDEKFRLDDYIGGGAFGKVYKASGLISKQVVAIKMAPEHKLGDPTTLALRTVLNETKAEMVKIVHPNVVRVLFADPGTDTAVGPYVMMEYIDGGSLQGLLDERIGQSKQFELDEALELMRGITLGAQAINDHLIHRDIKPDNILLAKQSDRLTPKIADFGIAKVAVQLTRPETFKGIQSIWYMAPEVWRDEKHTTKIDVYSVGLVFHQLLTLEHPLLAYVSDSWDIVKWRSAHLFELCADVRSQRDDVPLALARLLLRMTDKSPNNRPAWNDVLQSLEPGTDPPTRKIVVEERVRAAFKHQAEEGLRQERERSKRELDRQRKAEIESAHRAEYVRSATRLLSQFDEIITVLNEEEPAFAIQIQGAPPAGGESLMRSYVAPNQHRIDCILSDYASGMQSPRGPILGGGYLGINGALSANLVLIGQPDDIASAHWSGVEVTVMALIAGNARLRRYQEAGLTDADLLFLEGWKQETWSRDAPRYFGFKEISRFFNEFIAGISAMHVYSFNMRPNPVEVFNEILMVGIRMPSRSSVALY